MSSQEKPRAFRVQKIMAEGVEEPTGKTRLATRLCAANECKNIDNLRKCARCQLLQYCSKECQREHWPEHKESCKWMQEMRLPGAEPPMRRHLRLFNARFQASLMFAAIMAMDLTHNPRNIDTLGCFVTVHPRPHTEAGSRFKLHKFEVKTMTEMQMLFSAGTGPATFKQHAIEREKLKRKTNGEEDYITMIVFAVNHGSTPLLGGVETHGAEMRFKPISVRKSMMRSPQLMDPSLDWKTTIRIQIDNDLPSQTLV